MTIIAPNKYDKSQDKNVSFFLAGTIDNGNSVDWQGDLMKYSDEIGVTVLNPRRPDWGSNYSIDEQIEWELDNLENSDFIIMNILPDSKSPICLLEIGLFARSGKLTVFCPKSFYRYDNVRVTCEKYGVRLYSIENYKDNMDEIKLLMLEKRNAKLK